MPKRTKPYLDRRVLVNGGRKEFAGFANGHPLYDVISDELPTDTDAIRRQIAAHVQTFAELSLLPDLQQLISDLKFECESAMTLRLDRRTQGARTKPDEWTTQILVRKVGVVLKRHGLKDLISEYERRGQKVQSLYFRVVPGLIRIAGLPVPKDVKGLCLRSRRIYTLS